MNQSTGNKELDRDIVLGAYNQAKRINQKLFEKGDEKATSEYIYANQITDANAIVNEFYKNNRRVVSVAKKTKVGMDGLMIQIATLMTTHPDDNFVVNYENVRIITGMSNAGWEKDMKDKSPECFRDKIFHHGQLLNADLNNLQNGLIIIDEIDSGDKEFQRLHTTLKDAGVLDVNHMQKNNNRFVFVSATMIKELYHLYRWGDLHQLYKMTIPSSYIGHSDFLKLDIIKEFYPMLESENAEKWVQEDIIDIYGTDYRIHLARVTVKSVNILQNACIRKGIAFRNHTSTDRLTNEEIKELFKEPLTRHIVLGVKGFFRRANLIPNMWKLRIGATHEYYIKNVDNNVQIQGLPGRMTGYWRDIIEGGHKTGPHRTSIKAVEEYEHAFNDPFGLNSYQTSGFKKKKGKVVSDPTMLSAKHIQNLNPVDLPVMKEEKVDVNLYRIYSDENITHNVCKMLGYKYVATEDNTEGFKETSLNNKTSVVSLQDAVKKVPTAYGTNKGVKTYRVYYPCYVDTNDKLSLRFVVIIRPGTDASKVVECDAKYHSLVF